MMNQKDYGFAEKFATASDAELVEHYNREVGQNAWGTARAHYLTALQREMGRRNFDTSAIMQGDRMSLQCKVRLVSRKLEVLPEIVRKTGEKATAAVYIGLGKGFSGALQEEEHYLQFLQEYQKTLYRMRGLHLSATATKTELVSGGLREPHLRFHFVNLPGSAMTTLRFEAEVLRLAEAFMHEFDQKRVLIEADHKTCLLESTAETDPRIIGGDRNHL